MSARVAEVVSFEAVTDPAARGSRRVIVRWDDGTVGEALRWYDDETGVTEGDVLGKTADELRALHFTRDRDWLQSPEP